MTEPLEEGHTIRRYDSELSHLLMLVLQMGGMALNQTQGVLQALRNRDLVALQKIVEQDDDIDSLELQADEEIVSIIARRGPVARDLRIIMAASKAVKDLERVGDEAAKIAKMGLDIYDNERSDPSERLMRDITVMGKQIVLMLRQALDIFDQLDANKAEAMAFGRVDLELDFEASLRRLTTYIMEDHRNLGHVISIVLIIKALERIGDHARNISEHVVYMVRGTNVRYRLQERHKNKQGEKSSLANPSSTSEKGTDR